MAYIRILNMKAICCKDLTVKEIPTTVMWTMLNVRWELPLT
jgi:hypothetical protein